MNYWFIGNHNYSFLFVFYLGHDVIEESSQTLRSSPDSISCQIHNTIKNFLTSKKEETSKYYLKSSKILLFLT